MRPINSQFARLFYGQAISAVGNYVFDTTLILWIGTKLLAGRSYAPAAVSGVLIALALAIIVFAPFAGVFVDRWDKRRTMMASDLIRAALVTALLLVVLLPTGTLPVGMVLAVIYVVVFLSTGVANFFSPANFAFVGDIVPGDAARAKASSLTQAASYGAAIVGPPLAAPLLFTAGVYWALIINAASFVVSFLMVRGIKIVDRRPVTLTAPEIATTVAVPGTVEEEARTPEPPNFLREFVAGLRFVAHSRAMRVLLVMVTVATAGTAALNALNVFFVSANLHVDAHWYGTIGMGEGIGAIVGSVAAGWACRAIGDTRVLYLGLIAIGVGLVVYARLDNLPAAIAVTAVLAVPLGALNVALTPIVLRTVPREMLGRAVSVVGPIQQLAGMVSVLVAGWLVSTVLVGFHHTVGALTFGPIDTIFVVSGLLTAAAGVYAAFGLRGLGAPAAAAPTDSTPMAEAVSS